MALDYSFPVAMAPSPAACRRPSACRTTWRLRRWPASATRPCARSSSCRYRRHRQRLHWRSEPGTGSDMASIKTTARTVGDDYVRACATAQHRVIGDRGSALGRALLSGASHGDDDPVSNTASICFQVGGFYGGKMNYMVGADTVSAIRPGSLARIFHERGAVWVCGRRSGSSADVQKRS